MQGTISRLSIERGYGFIEPLDVGPDVFFHCKALAPDLLFDEQLRGRRVVFETFTTGKGPRASNVRPVD